MAKQLMYMFYVWEDTVHISINKILHIIVLVPEQNIYLIFVWLQFSYS